MTGYTLPPACALYPCVMLIDGGRTDNESSSQVLHVYPSSARNAGRARAMSSVLVALFGVTSRVTGQQVRCVTFPDPSPGFKATYVLCQNNALLVFCWPLDLADAPAIKLAHTISDLLSSVLGPVAGWSENNACKAHGPQESVQAQAEAEDQPDSRLSRQGQEHSQAQLLSDAKVYSQLSSAARHQFDMLIGSVFQQLCLRGWQASAMASILNNGVPASTVPRQVGTVVEAAVSELEAMVVTLQPESFVGKPQACLFYKGAVVVSHLSPPVTRSVWALAWGLSLFQRTCTHPPLAMLQDVQLPTQPHCTTGVGSMHNQTAETTSLSLLIVAVEHSVLCLGLWPRPAATAGDISGSALVSLASECLHKLCSRDGPLSLIRHNVLSPAAAPVSGHGTGTVNAQAASQAKDTKHQGHSLLFSPVTGRISCDDTLADSSQQRAQDTKDFCAKACWMYDKLVTLDQLTQSSNHVGPHITVRLVNVKGHGYAKGQSGGCIPDGARSVDSEGQAVIPAVHGFHSASHENDNKAELLSAVKLSLRYSSQQHRHAEEAASSSCNYVTGWLSGNAAFACHT